jgi:GT2 family glycosyltransferase
MPVVAIVPTLNRLADLTRCLDAIDGQTAKPERVLVVDNGSTDGTAARAAERAELIQLGEPVGAAAAFAAGMRAALDGGADRLWLLDDDAVPAPDALERLTGRIAAAEPGAPVGGAVPMLEVGDHERYAGWLAGAGGQSRNGGAPEVDWGPFAGLLLVADACRAVGELRSDFVLWHADVEYCLRLRRAGFRLLAAPDAVVRHPPMPLTSRRLLGRTFAVGDYPAWREYYDTRNGVLLRRELRGSAFEDRRPLWRRAAAELTRDGATVAAAGPRRVLMRALGLVDGLRGRTDRRPERA